MVASVESARVVRVVAVSPGDVQAERDRLESVIDELNRGVARERRCRLSLWRWETDAYPGLHLEGPQGLIDDAMRIEDADVVVGIFWKRFGTPTLDAGSGTEHELRRAWRAWQDGQRPQVMVYFCERKHMPKDSAEAAHLQQLLSFREAMPKEQLWWRYVAVADFERAVRQHLTAFVLALEPGTAATAHPTPVAVARRRRLRFGLPLAAAYFTGRDAELDAIEEALGVADRAVVTQAIIGLGGVGKSQLAARYVHEHIDEYDVVAWIGAEDGGIADLSEFAADLDLPVAQLSPVRRAASALRWLGGCDERWLLVLDNVATSEQLGGCCPGSGNGRVIVTTRDRAMAQFAPTLRVDVFDEAAAVEYLLAASGRTRDRDGASRLARALGFLPLALSHAGAYCAAGTSFDDYLELLGALPAAALFDDHPEVSYRQTVASTWQVSILAAEREAPLARRVLAMAAHLAPDAIPRRLFDVLLDDADAAVGRKRLLDAFNALHRLSLAEVDDAVISVHRLLQKTIRDDALERGDVTAAVNALSAVMAAFPSDHGQPQMWPQAERLLPHALAIATAAALMPTDETGQQLVTLLNSASDYMLRADKGARAVDVATQASACAQRILGGEHPATMRAGAILGLAYGEAGRFVEAIELGRRVFADCERILGPEHPDTLSACADLARSYEEAGRTTEAINLGERALADSTRILGPDHPDTLRAGVILGLSHSVAGRTKEAIELGERALAECERVLGSEDPYTLSAGGAMVFAYALAARTTEAIELGERALADSKRILGPNHPDTLLVSMVLVFSYAEAGRSTQAIKLGKRVFADSKRILGPDHPYTLRASIVLVFSYGRAGRSSEATELGEPVLADSKRILGPDHPYTLRAGIELAFSYGEAGRFEEAIKLGERALADRDSILDPNHPSTLSARANLARFYRQAGRNADAINLGEQVVADYERILGLDHPSTLSARANLTDFYLVARATRR
jgi:tetratricopeptide (TPR) repeat protein